MIEIIGDPEGAYRYITEARLNTTGAMLLVYAEVKSGVVRAMPLGIEDIVDVRDLPRSRRFSFRGSAEPELAPVPLTGSPRPNEAQSRAITHLRQIEALATVTNQKYFELRNNLAFIRGVARRALSELTTS